MKNKILVFIIIVLLSVVVFLNPKNEVKEEIKNISVYLDDKINLSLDDYLIGVVGCEMPASFNYEAIKAQAVASRTFAYNYLQNNIINISSNAQCFKSNEELKNTWKDDYDKYYQIIKSAITSTKYEVIKYNNEIIKSYYFAMSNGKTSTAKAVFNEELPYLTIIDSSFEESVNKFEVINTFSYQNFCNLLNINPCIINITNIIRDDSNRITSLFINEKKYDGITIRKLLNLRSTDFYINLLKDEIEIKTKGYGHGVGMSQYGANYLASINYNYIDILKYYYKDVNVEKY